MEYSRKAKNINPSITLAITAKAKALKAEGVDVVSFGAGEPDFNTPKNIIDAAIRAMEEGKTKYTPTAGIIELREAICNKLEGAVQGNVFTHASITAKPFFEKRGYRTVREQTVIRCGQALKNYRMEL